MRLLGGAVEGQGGGDGEAVEFGGGDAGVFEGGGLDIDFEVEDTGFGGDGAGEAPIDEGAGDLGGAENLQAA